MEPTIFALALAVLLVLILLISCWKSSCSKNKHKSHKRNKSCRDGMTSSNDLSNSDGVNEFENYNDLIKHESLDPAVFKSHDSYAMELGDVTRGASALSVRSDPNDIVPWVGLRRPNYHDVYTGEDARQDSSESPDQMYKQSHYML